VKVLKFAKVDFYKFKVLYQKRLQGGLKLLSRPLIPLFKSPNPLIRSRCMQWCFALHAVYHQTSVRQILKLELAYHGSKFSAKRSAA